MDDIKFRSFDSGKPVGRPTPPPRVSTTTKPASTKPTPVTPKHQAVTPTINTEEPLIPLDRLKQDKKAKKPRKKRTKPRVSRPARKGLLLFLLIGLLGVFAYVGYSYVSTRNSELEKANQFENNSEELAIAIKKHVAKYLEDVPEETPELETIDDPATAGNSAPFKDSQHGDKVLYFKSASKAIIYRPSTKKVLVYTYFATSSSSSTDQEQLNDQESTQQNTSNTAKPVDTSNTSDSTTPSPLLR